MLIDIVQLQLKSGKGGDGKVSFRREKFVPRGGPDGGDGGDGGSVYLRVQPGMNTLQHFVGRKSFQAEVGQPGGGRQKIGGKGEDLYLDIPIGTVVWEIPEAQSAQLPSLVDDEVVEELADGAPEFIVRQEALKNLDLRKLEKNLLFEATEAGQVFEVCKGGQGGRGNERFKSSTNTTPLKAEKGTPAEEKTVVLELKLLADLGLVGLPNAGKSTFLSLVTRANPQIANYPFTTITPNLGVLHLPNKRREVVIADIPGIIEGASVGKGLGIQFLRHIERCRALMYVLFLEESVANNNEVLEQDKANMLWEQFQTLSQELTRYDPKLMLLPSLVTINKSDLYPESLRQKITEKFVMEKTEIVLWSGITQSGVDSVILAIEAVL